MSNKKIFTIATEEYLNELISKIELPKGDSAYQVALNNGFEGSELEWLESLRGADGANGANGEPGKSAYQHATDNGFEGSELEWLESLRGTFNIDMVYDILQTEDKTVVGAVNEMYNMLKDWMKPVYDIKAQLFYGVINPTSSGVISRYDEITLDMLNNESGVKSIIPDERPSLSLGFVEEGSYIVIAVPAIYDFTVTKDNGFGGKIEFDESIIGANGIDVEFDNTDYRIYGEFVLVGGERTVYIEKRVEPEKPEEPENPGSGGTGGNCNCVDITEEDISDVMDDVFGPRE